MTPIRKAVALLNMGVDMGLVLDALRRQGLGLEEAYRVLLQAKQHVATRCAS